MDDTLRDRLARIGAEFRLRQIKAEGDALRRAFPEIEEERRAMAIRERMARARAAKKQRA